MTYGVPHCASFFLLQTSLCGVPPPKKKNDSLKKKQFLPLSVKIFFQKRLKLQRLLLQLRRNEGSRCYGIQGNRCQITYSQWIHVHCKTMCT